MKDLETRTVQADEVTAGMHMMSTTPYGRWVGPRISLVTTSRYAVTVETVNGGRMELHRSDSVEVVDGWPDPFGQRIWSWTTPSPAGGRRG